VNLNKPIPHKHRDVIIAFADGAKIQYREHADAKWKDVVDPSWITDYEYRAKPIPIFAYVNVYPGYRGNINSHTHKDRAIAIASATDGNGRHHVNTIEMQFDPTTDELIAVSILRT
jgi:hypothetical protein